MLPRLTLLQAKRSTRSLSTSSGAVQRLLEKKPKDVVVTFAKRTAMGRAKKGQLKDTPVDELLQALFKATLKETKLDPAKIEDICVGTCHPPSPLYVSRAAALAASIPAEVPISTVNRLCASGLQAIRSIAHGIESGAISLGMAVGVESMSLNPRPTPEVVDAVKAHVQAADCIQVGTRIQSIARTLIHLGSQPMGWTSEMVAVSYDVSREKQDQYALISHTRAERASDSGIFAEEIIPIELRGSVVSVDDTIRKGVTAESLSKLKPAFEWGKQSTTAGNASGVGDGAGICILTTRERADAEGWGILGKYVASTFVGVEPRYMGISPVAAIPKILAQTGLAKEDIDIYEINEAFASQFAYCVEQLQVPMEKVNPK
ncbi:hypothetical protein EIP86_002847 [Pleurotus ostreatoroseus]|nr:hypothetical protein EIP86_002847 [Pleurotus ostreatoroseus]